MSEAFFALAKSFHVVPEVYESGLVASKRRISPVVDATAGSTETTGISPLPMSAKTVEKVATSRPDRERAFALLPGALDSSWSPVK
jgi:hypothetical protein